MIKPPEDVPLVEFLHSHARIQVSVVVVSIFTRVTSIERYYFPSFVD